MKYITSKQYSPHEGPTIFGGMVEIGQAVMDECDACGAERMCLNYSYYDGTETTDRLICAQCWRDVAEWLDEYEQATADHTPPYDGPITEDLS